MLTLEATRSGATIVGEDLGTVPRSVRPSMARHGIRRGSWVLPFELRGRGRLTRPTARSVASLSTHDLFPFAGFWRGSGPGPPCGSGVARWRAGERAARSRAASEDAEGEGERS